MTIKTLHNQTLLDLAVQQYGSATMAIDLAIENNVSLTGESQAGITFKASLKDSGAQLIASYFQNKKIHPATSYSEELNGIVPAEIGIGNMRIGTTFKVK